MWRTLLPLLLGQCGHVSGAQPSLQPPLHRALPLPVLTPSSPQRLQLSPLKDSLRADIFQYFEDLGVQLKNLLIQISIQRVDMESEAGQLFPGACRLLLPGQSEQLFLASQCLSSDCLAPGLNERRTVTGDLQRASSSRTWCIFRHNALLFIPERWKIDHIMISEPSV